MSDSDILYCAYGSNLDTARMQKRTGPFREATVATLSGYRLAFNKEAQDGGVYANIVPEPGAEV